MEIPNQPTLISHFYRSSNVKMGTDKNKIRNVKKIWKHRRKQFCCGPTIFKFYRIFTVMTIFLYYSNYQISKYVNIYGPFFI